MRALQFLPQTDICNRDRMLPSQPPMRQHFRGGDFYWDLERVTTSILPIASVHEKFDIRLAPGVSYETLGSDLSTLHFLQLLVRLTGARNVLEIGTYVGVSAMFLAEAVDEGGHVTTIETGEEFAEIARENFKRNGLDGRISLYSALPDDQFDLIFLDGGKEQYGKMLPNLLGMLNINGLLAVDDVFCNGDTLNARPTTDKGRGVRDLLEQVAKLNGYSSVILPYGNGLLLLVKP